MDEFQEKQKQNQKVYEAAKKIVDDWPEWKRELVVQIMEEKGMIEEDCTEADCEECAEWDCGNNKGWETDSKKKKIELYLRDEMFCYYEDCVEMVRVELEDLVDLIWRTGFVPSPKIPPKGKWVMVRSKGADFWSPAKSSGELSHGRLVCENRSSYPDWRPMTDDEIWNGEEE